MKLSEMYGKRVESLNGVTCGYVLGVRSSHDKIRFLHCSDLADKEFFIDVNDLTEKDGQLIFTRGAKCAKGCLPVRLGSLVYSESGKFLGYLTEAECANFTIKHILVGTKKYTAKRVIFGDAIIIKKAIRPNISPDQAQLATAAKDMFIAHICS